MISDLEIALAGVSNKIFKHIKELEFENKKLKTENSKLNAELDNLAGYEIDKYDLARVHTSSALIKEIEKRYSEANLRVIHCDMNTYGKYTFRLEIGRWKWDDTIKFIGKQYFRTKRFTSSDSDGYDDAGKFVRELLGLKELGMGGLSTSWYRQEIPIPEGFVFDIEI